MQIPHWLPRNTGRDGEVADCILFYAYKDKQVLESMIRKSSPNQWSDGTQRKIDQLYTCVEYCENEWRCRRTLQLEFFGEEFDEKLCNKTCDNCRSGNEPEIRDMTQEGRAILNLLNAVSLRRSSGGVTIKQLSDLYRGSKSQSLAKSFGNLSGLEGYGSGSKYKIYDIERIMHAMILKKLLVEMSVANQSGFAADYIQMGPGANAVRNGLTTFHVEFPKPKPKAATKTKQNPKKSTAQKQYEKTATTTTTAKAGKKRVKSAARGPESFQVDEVLGVDDKSDDDDDDDASEFLGPGNAKEAGDIPALLPQKHIKALVELIKQLTVYWAEEERLSGGNVQYWNILSTQSIKAIASSAPTTVEDLTALGVLGEKQIEEYGARIVKPIKKYVMDNKLEDLISSRPRKRPKRNDGDNKEAKPKAVTKPHLIAIDDDDDGGEIEFDDGLFDNMDLSKVP